MKHIDESNNTTKVINSSLINENKEIEEKCASLVQIFISRGKNLIFEENHEEWIDFVKSNKDAANIIVAALQIMEKLEQGGTIEDANQILVERRDTIYPALVAKLVLKFSPYGAHFYQNYNCVINPETSHYEWKMLEDINTRNIILGRKYSKVIPELIKGFSAKEGESLEDILSTLFAAQERGIKIFAIYQGKKLYSETITMDSAYMKVYGITRNEYLKNNPVQKKIVKK